MSSLKFTDPDHWDLLERHLAGSGARFAFARTHLLATVGEGPVLAVVGIDLIDDGEVEATRSGHHLAESALDRVHNGAIRGGYGLVEFHNHFGGRPGFSPTDEAGLTPMAAFVTSILPNRPYGAGVYGDGIVHVEHWTSTPAGTVRGVFRSVLVIDPQHLRLVNALRQPGAVARLERQADLIGETGYDTLGALKVAVVGAGGNGSHAVIALAYLGFTDLLLLDDDHVETSNLNRLVTAGVADIGAPKALVARRRIREIDPGISALVLPALTPNGDHLELYDVDLIIGCVDNDGPRNRLNQIAVETATPYIDIATGIDTSADTSLVGGRVAFVSPWGPCLHCLDELDPDEVGRWAKDPEQQNLDRLHGYSSGQINPAVVHLNALAVYSAVAELIAWISGSRSPAQFVDIDLSGFLQRPGSPVGVRVAPRHPQSKKADCFVFGTQPAGKLSST